MSVATEPGVKTGPRIRPSSARAQRRRLPSWLRINLWRLVILVVVLGCWQYLPKVQFLHNRWSIFNEFFVSSPSKIAENFWKMTIGGDGQETYWLYLWMTLKATFLGVVIGTLAGAFGGLLLSNSPTLGKILSPFITMLNATPRIALVPVFVILAGPTLTSSVLVCVAVVFFIAFYNALAGGRSVPRQSLQNAELLGASPLEIIRVVRLPYVMVWTFASLPNAISFGLISVVTAEILTGVPGMGRLLSISIQTVDATLTFTVVVVLTIVGLIIFTGTDWVQRRILHWWHNA
jgi:NitT/TauT family transport system permease protein